MGHMPNRTTIYFTRHALPIRLIRLVIGFPLATFVGNPL
jgi:hypothetical protein